MVNYGMSVLFSVTQQRRVVAKTRVGGLALKVTPDQFVEGVIKWMKGEVGDSTVDVVVNDMPADTGSTDEPSFDSFVITE